VSSIGEVPVNSLINSFTRGFMEHQIGLTLPEVSAEVPDGLDPSEVSANLPALDPWDEGWQDPEEAQS
jgi:hypothetical protein